MAGGGDIAVLLSGDVRDFVAALPALRAVRVHHRGARITLLTTPALHTLASDAPYFDEVEAIDPVADPKVFIRLAQQFKKAGVAAVYDFDRASLAERLFAATKPFPPAWIGVLRGAKFRIASEALRGVHPAEAGLKQIAAAGLATHDPTPDASWAATARRSAPSLKPAFFGLTEPYVLLMPSIQRERGPVWPAARYAGLAVRLTGQGVGVAVATDGDDRPAARAIVQACPAVKDLAGRADMTQIAALAASSRGAFGAFDNSLLHLAAAAGAATIALAPSHETGTLKGPRGRAVMILAAADPNGVTVEYATALFRMFARIGEDTPVTLSPELGRRAPAADATPSSA